MGDMCLLEVVELCLDFLEPWARFLLFSFLAAFSSACWAMSSRMRAPLSTTTNCGSHMDPEGDRCGVVSGVQSSCASSNTLGYRPKESSSSEKEEETWLCSPDSEFMEERRGHDGYAQDGDCARELDEAGISMAEEEE
jgi:hypothetical protein